MSGSLKVLVDTSHLTITLVGELRAFHDPDASSGIWKRLLLQRQKRSFLLHMQNRMWKNIFLLFTDVSWKNFCWRCSPPQTCGIYQWYWGADCSALRSQALVLCKQQPFWTHPVACLGTVTLVVSRKLAKTNFKYREKKEHTVKFCL